MSIQYVLSNGVGNYPDADKFMADFYWIFSMCKGTFLQGGGFELWTAGTSFTNPADGTTLSDGWTLQKGGTSTATADITRESSTKDTGSYSMKVNISAAGSSNSYLRIKQSVSNFARFAGLTMHFGVKVKVGTASKVRLSIYDGVTTAYSSYHTGGGTFEKLTVPLACSASITELTIKVEITSDFASDPVYIDSAFLYNVDTGMSSTSRDALEYFSPDDPLALLLGALTVNGTVTVTGTIALTGAMTISSGLTVSGALTHTVMKYRRPILKWVSVTTVDVENNTGTANETTILFSDGSFRSVTEDTSSTNKYRRFIITAAAEFTSGTEDSGIRSGISEANNTWYAIYAVKSLIDSTKFVLAGDTTLPTQANFATLNSRYGTDGWVYLGLIRNGDSGTAAGDILNFVQAGNRTSFINTLPAADTASGGRPTVGILINSGSTVGNISYTYSAGTGDLNIPNNISMCYWHAMYSTGNDNKFVRDSGANRYYAEQANGSSKKAIIPVMIPASEGIRLDIGSGTDSFDIVLAGFVDGVLGATNPLL
jgi:hypothetical protein